MVKEGYKQTDIGVIPDDWEVCSLNQIGIFSKGKGVKKDEALSGELPCIRYGEIYTYHNDYIKKFNSFISIEISHNAKKIKQGDILFAGSGETKEEIGKCVAFIDNIDAYAGGDIVILSPVNVNSLFLGYILNIHSIAKQKASKGQGDAVVHISANSLGNVIIPVPPQSEQKTISQALSDTDELITSLDKLIVKKEAIKQGTMQQLLTGKKRLSGFSREWKEIKLEEIINCLRGVSYNGSTDLFPTDSEKSIRLLRSNNIKNSQLINKDLQFVINERVSKNQIMQHNDILICMANGSKELVGKTALFNIKDKYYSYTFGAFMGCIRKYNPNYSTEFIFYLLQTKRFRNYIDILLAGSSINNLKSSDIESLIFNMPIIEEQQAITKILLDMDNEIEMLKSKLSKTKAIKEAMMSELLTGKTRLTQGI